MYRVKDEGSKPVVLVGFMITEPVSERTENAKSNDRVDGVDRRLPVERVYVRCRKKRGHRY